jgi:hypothetical protein
MWVEMVAQVFFLISRVRQFNGQEVGVVVIARLQAGSGGAGGGGQMEDQAGDTLATAWSNDLPVVAVAVGNGVAPPTNGSGAAGGSGVVVLRVPNTAAAVFSGGVATRSYDVVGYTTYEVQATTTTGETVTFYPNAFLAEYLVVAGGGSGGSSTTFQVGGGGGGGGGYLASADAVAMAVVTGQAYPIIVGAGGAVANAAVGNDGSPSQFASILATGGGGGGHLGGPAPDKAGRSGGSGGGGSAQDSVNILGGAGNTPFRSPSQGNNGGDSNTSTAPNYGSGGGGGANAVGGNGSNTAGGAGGAGKSNAITGVSPNSIYMLAVAGAVPQDNFSQTGCTSRCRNWRRLVEDWRRCSASKDLQAQAMVLLDQPILVVAVAVLVSIDGVGFESNH